MFCERRKRIIKIKDTKVMEKMLSGMGGVKNPEKKKNPLKSEHLKEGVKPIMVCLRTQHYSMENSVSEDSVSRKSNTHNVDYYRKADDLAKKSFMSNGDGTYVVSTVDSLDKMSSGLMDCNGVLVAGKDKETGEEISLLSHQDPKHFLMKDNSEKFKNDLRGRLCIVLNTNLNYLVK
jgi:hypothetical protein